MVKVKVISRNLDDYRRETNQDIHKLVRNYNAGDDPFQAQTEYIRALNATKLERVFAKPFIASMDGHRDGVSVIYKHPLRSSTILSGARDGEVRVWNLPARQCIGTIQAHTGSVFGISIDQNTGENFVSVGGDTQLKLWRLPVFGNEGNIDEPMHSIPLGEVASSVSHLCRSNDFVTGGEAVNVWKPFRDAPVRTYNVGINQINNVRGNPIEENVIVGSSIDRSIFILDTRQAVHVKKVTMKLRPNAIAWNPMEAYSFAVANNDFNVYSFDTRHLKNPVNVHVGHQAPVMDLDYSPTGKELVSGAYDRTLRIFPVEGANAREIYHTKRMVEVLSVAWSMDNKFVLSGSNEMNIRVWKAKAAEKIGPKTAREEAALEYSEKLRENYKEHPEISRIQKHRHLPKGLKSLTRGHLVQKNAERKKDLKRHQIHEINPDRYSVPKPEKERHMAKTTD